MSERATSRPGTEVATQKGLASAGWLVPAVLVACSGVSILSTDLYLPSLPHLPALLDSDAATVQLTVSVNVAAYAVSQLLHGPLSDRFGRRFLLLAGLLAFCAASLLCALAGSIGTLMAGRVLQGLSASVGSVVILLIIRDLYGGPKAIQVMAAYGLAVGLTPAVGPLIGGYVYAWLGWRANFYLLAAAIVAVVLLVARYVPETGERDRDALRPLRMLRAYGGLLADRGYLRFYLPLTFLFGALFAFITEGPFLLIRRFGVATEDYGLYHAVLVLAYMAGNLVVGRLARRLRPIDFVHLSLVAAALGALLLLVPTLAGAASLLAIMTGIAVYALAMGLILASGPLCLFDALGPGPKGPASALLGASQMGAGSLAGLLVALTHDGTPLPMTGTMAGFLAVAVGGYLLCRPRREGRAEVPKQPSR